MHGPTFRVWPSDGSQVSLLWLVVDLSSHSWRHFALCWLITPLGNRKSTESFELVWAARLAVLFPTEQKQPYLPGQFVSKTPFLVILRGWIHKRVTFVLDFDHAHVTTPSIKSWKCLRRKMFSLTSRVMEEKLFVSAVALQMLSGYLNVVQRNVSSLSDNHLINNKGEFRYREIFFRVCLYLMHHYSTNETWQE